jgi:hypothetical protein
MPEDAVKYDECIVAYLDILGFKERVRDSKVEPETLKTIIESLKIVKAIPSGGKGVSDSTGDRTIELRTRSFSDSVVFLLKMPLGDVPCFRDVPHLFFLIRHLQDYLWQQGMCLRGSIVRGKMHWADPDDHVTVGPGLIDAYDTEQKVAVYPRIIVAADLCAQIADVNPTPFGRGTCARLGDLLREGEDKERFLDLLNPQVMRTERERLTPLGDGKFTILYYPAADTRLLQVLEDVDRIIRDNAGKGDKRVRAKYGWLEKYRASFDETTRSGD